MSNQNNCHFCIHETIQAAKVLIENGMSKDEAISKAIQEHAIHLTFAEEDEIRQHFEFEAE